MDLILATADGQEERVLDENLDLDVGVSNDFVLYASYGTWKGDLQIGKRIYIPGTEYGGIIKGIKSATNTGSISVSGLCWRGYLAKRIIQPPAGQDYYIGTGDLNAVIEQLVNIPGFVVADVNTGVHVQYQFNRYVDTLREQYGDCFGGCLDLGHTVLVGQDPVEMIPEFVREWENGYKIVIGIKTSSKESKIMRFLRTCYYKVIKKMSDVFAGKDDEYTF